MRRTRMTASLAIASLVLGGTTSVLAQRDDVNKAAGERGSAPPTTTPVDQDYSPGPPYGIPENRDWVPPSDSTVDKVVKEALADSSISDGRAQFGLEITDAAIAEAVIESMGRSDLVTPLGVPLTDRELQAADQWHRNVTLLSEFDNYARENGHAFASYESNRDIDNPMFFIQVTDAASVAQRDAAAALIPVSVPWEFRVVEFSTNEVLSAGVALQNSLRSGAPTEISSAAEAVGVAVLDVSLSASSQVLDVAVDIDRQGRSNEALTAELKRLAPSVGGVPYALTQTGPEVTPDGRLDSPGQAKGGVRVGVSDGLCTSGGSITSTVGFYNVTAGHCYNDNGPGPMTHQGATWGTVAAGRYRDQQGSLTVRALDYALALVSTGGMISEYMMEVSDLTGQASYHTISSTNMVAETTSTIVCYGGASPHRPLIYSSSPFRTLCGWVTQAWSGSGRVKVSINVCSGDSGALVYAYNQAYGLVSRSEAFIAGTNNLCASVMMYARMAAQLFDIGNGAVMVGRSFGNLTFAHSAQCLDAAYAGTSNPTTITQYPCHNQVPQRWRLVPTNGGNSDTYYVIRNDGMYCLDAPGVTNGSIVNQWGCHFGVNQQWRIVRTVPGHFSLRPMSAIGQCVDIGNSSTAPGALTTLWSCHGGSNQSVRI